MDIVELKLNDDLNSKTMNDSLISLDVTMYSRNVGENKQIISDIVKLSPLNLIEGDGEDNKLIGGKENDLIKGYGGKDRLVGRGGNDELKGGIGNDILIGNGGNYLMVGEGGSDGLWGNMGRDTLTGGNGKDKFYLDETSLVESVEEADIITDFNLEQDKISLSSKFNFEQLEIMGGSGKNEGSTIIKDIETGKNLVIVLNIAPEQLSVDNFIEIKEEMQPLPASISTSTVKFTPSDSEAEIANQGGAKLTIGKQNIYIGTWQVSSNNQNPIIVSFDSENPGNNWVRTDYETTGADGRGYGLFWDGDDLYAVFSTDGTQGSVNEDFRRAAADNTQAWTRSYGSGGGAKIAVIAKIDETTGEMTDAAFISALLSNGNSNSMVIKDINLDGQGDLLINADSWFSPRNPDGSPMTQVETGSSPFDYTLEITPDLSIVLTTAAVGWVS